MKKILFMIVLCLVGCSSADDRSQGRRMKENKATEKIYRLSHQKFYTEEPAELVKKDPYPWESGTAFSKITVDSFRCQGRRNHQKRQRDGKEYADCGGLAEHGLPYADKDEFVYSVMIKLLNQVQNAFQKKVVITSGHRCPKHHSYITMGKSKISRYMIGAKVDFFIEGMEEKPHEIIEKLKSFYKNDQGYSEFREVRNNDGTRSWHNKEVILTINPEGEHTKLQNRNHPVVSIDVRYDRDKEESIILDWKRAYEGYIRH
ncbi:MAG: hypothetical protein S4CHLAM20_03560 [Chlamydiia bacterium]|nr:hypothetical protein [Chlamydiia bacterium]